MFGQSILVGDSWTEVELTRLATLREENTDLSQRGFARDLLYLFPGRTFNGLYHKVRNFDYGIQRQINEAAKAALV